MRITGSTADPSTTVHLTGNSILIFPEFELGKAPGSVVEDGTFEFLLPGPAFAEVSKFFIFYSFFWSCMSSLPPLCHYRHIPHSLKNELTWFFREKILSNLG